MKVSARNVFLGTVASIKRGAVNGEVILDLKGGSRVAVIIDPTWWDNIPY
jgi:molybdate transport system regulatory protein